MTQKKDAYKPKKNGWFRGKKSLSWTMTSLNRMNKKRAGRGLNTFGF